MSFDRLLDQNELGNLIGVTGRHLANLRVTGDGPPFVKVGAAVRYDPADAMAWLKARKRRSTSEQPAKAA